MKNNEPTPTSTSRDFKLFYFACKYIPNDTRFCKPCTISSSLQSSTSNIEIISDLPKYIMKSCIYCTVSRDEDGSYLIECSSLNLYSTGDSRQEAVENIKENIVSLYEDLMENDDFSDNWLEKKKLLRKIIGHNK